MVTFNVVQCPQDKLIPVIIYITTAGNSCAFTTLSVFSLLKFNKTKKFTGIPKAQRLLS